LLLTRSSRFAEAEKEYRAALPLWQAVAAAFPAEPLYRLRHGGCHNLLGTMLDNAGRPREAEAEHRRALAILGPLAEQPGTALYRNELAGNMVNLARKLIRQDQHAEARRWLEQAGPHHQAALAAEPRNAVYRLYFRNNRWVLADCLVALGDHAATAQAVEQWVQTAVDAKHDPFNAACSLAHCVRLAEKDEALTATQRQELTQKYADRVLVLLRQAITNGFQDAEALKKTPALEPVRSRPEYQTLLTELETKRKE
jgi:tetratricopeptide (TPR) repeat protein